MPPGRTIPRPPWSPDGAFPCILFKPSDFPRQLEASPSAGPAFPTPAEGSTCWPLASLLPPLRVTSLFPSWQRLCRNDPIWKCLWASEQKIYTALFWGNTRVIRTTFSQVPISCQSCISLLLKMRPRHPHIHIRWGLRKTPLAPCPDLPTLKLHF